MEALQWVPLLKAINNQWVRRDITEQKDLESAVVSKKYPINSIINPKPVSSHQQLVSELPLDWTAIWLVGLVDYRNEPGVATD